MEYRPVGPIDPTRIHKRFKRFLAPGLSGIVELGAESDEDIYAYYGSNEENTIRTSQRVRDNELGFRNNELGFPEDDIVRELENAAL